MSANESDSKTRERVIMAICAVIVVVIIVWVVGGRADRDERAGGDGENGRTTSAERSRGGDGRPTGRVDVRAPSSTPAPRPRIDAPTGMTPTPAVDDPRLEEKERLVTEYRQLATELDAETLQFRNSKPVYTQIYDTLSSTIVPTLIEGEKARLEIAEARRANPDYFTNEFKYDQQKGRQYVWVEIIDTYEGLADDLPELLNSPDLALSEAEQRPVTQIIQMLDRLKTQVKEKEPPYAEGTMERLQLESEVGRTAFSLKNRLLQPVEKLPPYLEEKKVHANELLKRIHELDPYASEQFPKEYREPYLLPLQRMDEAIEKMRREYSSQGNVLEDEPDFLAVESYGPSGSDMYVWPSDPWGGARFEYAGVIDPGSDDIVLEFY